MIEIIILLITCVLVALILKLLNFRYIKSIKISKTESPASCHLFKRIPPYGAYKKVSKKASSKNSPKRTTGDFFDYIKDSITSNQNAIENNLLKIYGEDIDE